jgi:hypothetical protein
MPRWSALKPIGQGKSTACSRKRFVGGRADCSLPFGPCAPKSDNSIGCLSFMISNSFARAEDVLDFACRGVM